MARPQKQTIDYFPHFADSGKTKLVLLNEFGNDGYAFWYQLLELLCRTENQVYDYNNPSSWRLLLAETHVHEEQATKILKVLADLGTIDPKLNEAKIIWSQNLVENLELVYSRRATGTPVKPVIADINPVSVHIKRQTIQYNTILNNTIQLPDYIDKELWNDFLDMRKKSRKPATERAKTLLLVDLDKLRTAGDEPNEVLKQSIKNNWAGLFPLKNGGNDGKIRGNTQKGNAPKEHSSYARTYEGHS